MKRTFRNIGFYAAVLAALIVVYLLAGQQAPQISKKSMGELLRYLDDKKVAELTESGLSKEKDEFEIKRSKGLGENQPEMMSLTTMHPATRKLIRVTPENVERTAQMFDIFLGDALQERKDYIVQNGAMYMEMLDLS